MMERETEISNRLGLHARAAGKFVQTAARFGAQITLFAKGKEVNARSILGLMMLAAGKGTPIKLRASGDDADAALDALIDLVDRKFDEAE